jgi:hypothetical protein
MISLVTTPQDSDSLRPAVAPGTCFYILARLSFFAAFAALAAGAVCAQEPQAPPQQSPVMPAPLPTEFTNNVLVPCVQPPPLIRLEDYDGPLRKVVGVFYRHLERTSVHPPHYKPGVLLCTLSVRDKFILFVQDSADPVTFLGAAFNAGLDQAEDNDHSYGQGAQGYGRRFGAEYADDATSRFFKDFAYPSIFSEDPRYYRLAHGSTGKRLFHALSHAVVAHHDNGTRMFNFSEWLGTASAVAVSNTYHPDNQRGFSAAASRVGYGVLQDMGYDVLREFWPEIARKFKLPFHAEYAPVNPPSISPADGRS